MNFACQNYVPARKKDERKRKKRFQKSRTRSNEKHDCSKTSQIRRSSNLRALSDAAVSRLITKPESRADSVSNTFISVSNRHDSSSSADDFFDAKETLQDGNFTKMVKSNEVKVRFTTGCEGSFNAIFDGGCDDGKRFHVDRSDSEKFGVDMRILSNSGGAITIMMACGDKLSYVMNGDRFAEGHGDGPHPEKTHCEAQTSVILGADELSETEEMSLLSSFSAKCKTERYVDPILDSLIEVESHDVKEDTAGDISHFSESAMCSSLMISGVGDTTAELGGGSYTDSTHHYSSVSSIPEEAQFSEASTPGTTKSGSENWSAVQNLSAVRNLVNQLRSMLEDEIQESSRSSDNSAVFTPIIKAKSDSILVLRSMKNSSYEDPKSADNPSMICVAHTPKSSELEQSLNETDESEESETEEFQNDSQMTGTQSDSLSSVCAKLSGEEFEPPERPMTSAADAVTSMRQALKPISDQINIIKTKMIGMNIQPRTCQSKLVEEVLSKISLLESQFAPNSPKRILLLSTEPEDFTSQSAYDLRGSTEYLFRPSSFTRNLGIFPGRSYDIDESCAQTSEMSLARSSIVSDPDELSNVPTRNKQWF